MPDWLAGEGTIGADPLQVLVRLVVAALGGWVVAFVHERSGSAAVPRSFRATLVLLTVLISGVTLIIGDSVARAFALVGALSIVRFRTVVRDTRDTVFVIFAVTLGMAMGTGHLLTGALVALVVAPAAFLLRGRGVRDHGVYRLTVRLALGLQPAVVLQPVFAQHVARSQRSRVATARGGATVETSYEIWLAEGGDPGVMVDQINRLEGVQSVELELGDEGPPTR